MKQTIRLNNSTLIDLPTLIDSRLLVQANSGGGKSWLLRRILEQSHGKVQQIVIDLEGEFSTLREKYDYVLAGKGGDTPADPRSAALLARKLLEHRVSAIVDLYELHHQERKHFVRLFLESMINAPKELWHPCMVVIDEAHVFVPQAGESEAAEAVIDLATRGRKRGFCAVLATQRISKLHKDAAAECNNKLIGRTGLDIDMKRASEELGFTSKEQYLSLRSLAAGEFFAFGPAISREVMKVTIGEVQTTHPKLGMRAVKVIPPTENIKAILQKLGDLPQEARQEAQTVADLRSELAQLRRHRCERTPGPATKIERIEVPAVGKRALEGLKVAESHMRKMAKAVRDSALVIEQSIAKLSTDLEKVSLPSPHTIPAKDPGIAYGPHIQFQKYRVAPTVKKEIRRGQLVAMTPNGEVEPVGDVKLTGGALRMLQVLVSRHPMVFTRSQLATLAYLSPRSGTFGTYLSTLRSAGFIQEEHDHFQATQAGMDYIGHEPTPPQTPEENVAMWRGKLNGGARRMFDVLVSAYPDTLTREEVAEQAGLGPTTGTFGTYLSQLRSNELIEVRNGRMKVSENLFL